MKTTAELATMIRTAYAGIERQGCRAATSLGGCQYRTDTGLKCFVGQLIPDSKYDPAMENGGVRIKPDVREVLGIEGDPNAINVLADLQSIHDMSPVYHFDGDNQRWLRNLKRECNRQLREWNETLIP